MDKPEMREGAPHHGNASSEPNGRHDHHDKSLQADHDKSNATITPSERLTKEGSKARAIYWQRLDKDRKNATDKAAHLDGLSLDDRANLDASDEDAASNGGVPLWKRVFKSRFAEFTEPKVNGNVVAMPTARPHKHQASAEPPSNMPLVADTVTRAKLAEWYVQVANEVENDNLNWLDYFVAVHIGKCADNETGIAFPGENMLAKRAHCTTRAVRKSIARFQGCGLMRRPLRAKLAGYELILKASRE